MTLKIIVAIFILIFITACNKEENCPDKIRIPWEVHPIKSVYNVGDTLEFRSKFSANIRDVNGHLFNFGNNDWQNNFYIVVLDTIYEKGVQTSNYLKIVNSNEYNLQHFYSDISDDYEGMYKQEADSLTFIIQGVLIKPGIITPYSGVNSGPPLEASRNCRNNWTFNPPFQIIMNDGVNHNLSLTYEISDSVAGASIRNNIDAFNKSGGYLIKVVP